MSIYVADSQTESFACMNNKTPCPMHLYHVAHLCECGKLYSHSQSDCDRHRQHRCINFDPIHYSHGETARDVFDKLAVMGTLPYGTESFDAVYDYFARTA